MEFNTFHWFLSEELNIIREKKNIKKLGPQIAAKDSSLCIVYRLVIKFQEFLLALWEDNANIRLYVLLLTIKISFQFTTSNNSNVQTLKFHNSFRLIELFPNSS